MEESSTKLSSAQNMAVVLQSLNDERWEDVARTLPVDLEASAKAQGALKRPRKIRSAVVLLRTVLAYAVLDLPLRMVGAWGVVLDQADMSDVAVLKRLRNCRAWLGWLIVQLLATQHVRFAQRSGVRVCLRDATVISRPGSTGTDWRVHVSFDLENLRMDKIEVTDAHGGENLDRFTPSPGDIVVADRVHAFAKSLGSVLCHGADVVVRINWQNLPLWTDENERLDIIAWLKKAFVNGATPHQELSVQLPTPQGQFALRLVACQLPLEAAERARAKARKTAQKKGRTPDERTLFACGFTLVITSLSADLWPAVNVLDLYRTRWQIELYFKRLKSLMNFDGLRAHDPDLAQTYLLGKLLAALIVDTLNNAIVDIEPDWFLDTSRPVSLWRLTGLSWMQLCQLVCGVITRRMVLSCLSRLRRFLCEPPRKRPQQLTQARLFLNRLSVFNVLKLQRLS